jgi:hypothetical protein
MTQNLCPEDSASRHKKGEAGCLSLHVCFFYNSIPSNGLLAVA